MTEEAMIELPPLPNKLRDRISTYWDISFAEGRDGRSRGTVAQAVLDQIWSEMREYARQAVLQERERCAKVCEAYAAVLSKDEAPGSDWYSYGSTAAAECAYKIRKG